MGATVGQTRNRSSATETSKEVLKRKLYASYLHSGMMEKLPRDFCVNKVLPVLCSSFDIGIGGSAAFSSIVGLKPRMTDEEFKRKV